MKYMGIDPSTKTGLVCLDEASNVLLAVSPKFPEYKGHKRLHLIAKSVRNLLEEHKPDVVVVEGYAYGNKHTLVSMVETGTIIRQALYSLGISWYDVPPTQVKKFTTGKGNADKPLMAKYVSERWGFTSKSDDIVDAFAMAKLAQHIALNGAAKLEGVSHEEPAVS